MKALFHLFRNKPKAAPMNDALTTHDARAEAMRDTIAQIQAEQQGHILKRQGADALVAKLTEQAAAGKLKDASRLTEALRQQRDATQDTNTATRLQTAQTALQELEQQRNAMARQAAQDAYTDAVMAYAEAVSRAGLPELATKVRDLAPGAGMMLPRCLKCGHDGMHTLGSVAIGGAVIDLPRA